MQPNFVPPAICRDFQQPWRLRQFGVEIDQLDQFLVEVSQDLRLILGEDGEDYENYQLQNIVRSRQRLSAVRRELDLIAIADIGPGLREDTWAGRSW